MEDEPEQQPTEEVSSAVKKVLTVEQHLGQRLRLIREGRGMLLEDLVDLVNVELDILKSSDALKANSIDLSELRAIEKGKRLRDHAVRLQIIGQILDVSLVFLFSDKPISELLNEKPKKLSEAVRQIAKEKGVDFMAAEIEFFGSVNALRPQQIKGYQKYLEGALIVIDPKLD